MDKLNKGDTAIKINQFNHNEYRLGTYIYKIPLVFFNTTWWIFESVKCVTFKYWFLFP